MPETDRGSLTNLTKHSVINRSYKKQCTLNFFVYIFQLSFLFTKCLQSLCFFGVRIWSEKKWNCELKEKFCFWFNRDCPGVGTSAGAAGKDLYHGAVGGQGYKSSPQYSSQSHFGQEAPGQNVNSPPLHINICQVSSSKNDNEDCFFRVTVDPLSSTTLRRALFARCLMQLDCSSRVEFWCLYLFGWLRHGQFLVFLTGEYHERAYSQPQSGYSWQWGRYGISSWTSRSVLKFFIFWLVEIFEMKQKGKYLF